MRAIAGQCRSQTTVGRWFPCRVRQSVVVACSAKRIRSGAAMAVLNGMLKIKRDLPFTSSGRQLKLKSNIIRVLTPDSLQAVNGGFCNDSGRSDITECSICGGRG